MKSILTKLGNIQRDLKAPKSQFNSFAKYNYRNAEDILEALKPLLSKEKCVLVLNDDLVNLGERFYVKAFATLTCIETDERIESSALAREALDRKGQDESQITGTASSYARKYALNGLFCIDDTKDADTMENKEDVSGAIAKMNKAKTIPELTEIFKSLKDSEKKNPDVIQAGKNRKEVIMAEIPTV